MSDALVEPRPAGRTGLLRTLAALLLFGVSFGFVEAAVVVYLRALYEPIHERLHPGRSPGDLFPLIRLDELEAEGPEASHRLRVELVRELATLVMLASVGLAVGRNPRQVLAGFLVAFGVWDIAFYLFLKVLIDWPASFLTWDLLFLLPLPWAGPVIAPMLVAASMIGAGAWVLAAEARGRSFRPTWPEWAAIFSGGFVIVVAFCWDYRNILEGGVPRPFHWPLFALGEGIGLAGFLAAMSRLGRSNAPSRQIQPRRGDLVQPGASAPGAEI